MSRNWSKISLTYLFAVALIGTYLCSPYAASLPLEFKHLVHAHSHTAFQGWVYTIMFLLLTSIFIPKEKIKRGHYALQFRLTILIVLGVLVSFSLQGYGLYSIIFSTLFQVLNYWYIYRFIKDTGRTEPGPGNNIPLRFIKTGLWLGVLSTLMPFGIGFLAAKGQSGTELYNAFVYTFMHLQYNGWFMFVVLGLFYKFLDKNNVLFHHNHASRFYWLFTISIIPAIALSLLGMSFSRYFTLPAYFSAILLILGLFFFLLSLSRSTTGLLKRKSGWLKIYLLIFCTSFLLKTILQSLSVLPILQPYAFNNKLVIIAYLHLTLIGAISSMLFALMIEMNWMPGNWFTRSGNSLLLLGFASTELILTLGGFGIYYNHQLLLAGSIFMALGIFLLLINPDSKAQLENN